MLVFSGDGLWRPATNSPVRDVAAGLYPAVMDDFDRQVRLSAKDAGCDQFSTNPIVRRPLGPTDVGPEWMRTVAPNRTMDWVGNSVGLMWDIYPMLTYQVQFSSNLLTWATVSQVISNLQTTVSWVDDGSQTGGNPTSQTRRYYRIKLLP